MDDSGVSLHRSAADEFARRVRDRYGGMIDSVLLYGSVARGEERGVHSDVDLFIVLRDDVDKADLEEQIRDLAYDVELEYGVVLSLIVRSASAYERQQDRPFFQQVSGDAEVLYG